MSQWSIDLSNQDQPDGLPRSHIAFISHSGIDYEFVVGKVVPVLRNSCFDFHLENRTTRKNPIISNDYRKAITRSMSRCGCCLVILSSASVRSEWVTYEVHIAFSMAKPLLRVLVEECNWTILHPRLQETGIVDFSSDEARAIGALELWLSNRHQFPAV
jgi:TIR domain